MARRGRPKNEVDSATDFRALVRTIQEYAPPHDYLMSVLRSLPCEPPTMLPSEWAERNRVLTSVATPFPGKWSWKRSPFWRKPLDMMSPLDPTQRIAIMKATQVGFTTAFLQNFIGYGIACDPHPMLNVTGDENMVKKMKKVHIEPMIDASGLRDKIKPDSIKKGVRRTGDSGNLMEFPGGYLTMCGPNTEANFQMLSYRSLLLDEIDLYPHKLGASGETVSVIEGRSDAFGSRKKIVYGSRPTVAYGLSKSEEDKVDSGDQPEKTKEELGSRILDLYNDGDQQKYHVPCPHCGEMQTLEFFKGVAHNGVEYGLHFDSEACKNGDYSSVHYVCRGCGKRIEEHHKPDMLQPENGADWIPTTKAKYPYYHSFQISAMYSLTFKWWEIVMEFLKSVGDPLKMQIFYNKCLGLPFEDRSGGVDMSRVDTKIGGYTPNQLPKGVLFLTAAADVQTGQNARIEVEIKGWGRNFRNWSIDYRVFKGNVEDIYDECWRKVAAIIDETWGPKNMQVERLSIDSSDGNMKDTVYDACRFYGQGEAALMIPTKGLAVTSRTRDYYHIAELEGEVFPLLEVYSDNYKNRFAAWMRQDWRAEEAAPSGWPMFPSGYAREYFRQLGNEERRLIRQGAYTLVKWIKKGRNEALDCFVYNMAVADFVIEHYSKYILMMDNSSPEAVWDYFESFKD